MCRWLAYTGAPVLLQGALYSPANSFIDQSMHARLGAEPTNGDGFGVGWYDDAPVPGVFRSVEPAWNDHNLRELAGHIRSGHFFAHVRAAIGSAVQQTNCHPFRHGRWLWMHNGFVAEFAKIKRELALAIEPSLYTEISGQTDSEVLFLLALSLGLEADPPKAIAQTIGLVEYHGRLAGVENPFQGTIATSEGRRIWAFRYSSEGKSRSLFHSNDVPTLRKLYPKSEIINRLSDDAHLIVSEPIGDLPGAWREVPEASYCVVGDGENELCPFGVEPPTGALAG
jgi:predicted glutamine amidotransferase